MAQIRMAQVGTKHGHAAGKLRALQDNPQVDLAGIFEPDREQRAQVQDLAPYRDVPWFTTLDDILADDSIVAVSSEGANAESLDQTEALVQAGKHVWYDKPAGQKWDQWQRVVARAQAQNTEVQMGYMLRYHNGFAQIADWVHTGLLGQVFAVRAHMSTSIGLEQRARVSVHPGGIFYDLASHMLDQIVWLLGRPTKVTTFFRNDTGLVPAFRDNTLGVFEYDQGMATIDIAAMEPRPNARRYEVYGTEGSAIILEPFEPATVMRLCLTRARAPYPAGEVMVPIRSQTRQALYELELASLLDVIRGAKQRDRPYDHELAVQETLIRACGEMP